MASAPFLPISPTRSFDTYNDSTESKTLPGIKYIHNSEQTLRDPLSVVGSYRGEHYGSLSCPIQNGHRLGAIGEHSGHSLTFAATQNVMQDDNAGRRERGVPAIRVSSKENVRQSPVIDIVEPDAAMKNEPVAETPRINNIIKKVGMAISLTVAVLAVAIPVASALGIPIASLIIVQSVVVVLGVLLCVYAASKKDMAALLISSWAMTKVKQVQWVAASLIGWLTAVSNKASWQGQKFAACFSYCASQKFERWGFNETGMACANAVGAGVSTVDAKAREHGYKATEEMYCGTAAGVTIGSFLLKNINGSSEVGVMAGAGAFQGALAGRKVDDWSEEGAGIATAAIDAYWRFWLPETFSTRSEMEGTVGDNEKPPRSSDLSQHAGDSIATWVNAYWRFWLHDAVVPVYSQGNAVGSKSNAISNGMTVTGKNQGVGKEIPEASFVSDSKVGNAVADAQWSRPVSDEAVNNQGKAGWGGGVVWRLCRRSYRRRLCRGEPSL
ncbi:hypothetical protein ABK905_23975 [Acerihabitans sp. KWT182]|uniref:Uncharacterized protein n=1 Tax=Acerihabitans sp. KWT182 TaxID=3157919 RepID=A0AAU7Q8W9_9GAMM